MKLILEKIAEAEKLKEELQKAHDEINDNKKQTNDIINCLKVR